eukprot:9362654-Pyramimonas_sp.AAC.1
MGAALVDLRGSQSERFASPVAAGASRTHSDTFRHIRTLPGGATRSCDSSFDVFFSFCKTCCDEVFSPAAGPPYRGGQGPARTLWPACRAPAPIPKPEASSGCVVQYTRGTNVQNA